MKTVVYVKGKGGGKGYLFVDYLISQGVEVIEVESTGEIRGMTIDYIIVDECVKEAQDEYNNK